MTDWLLSTEASPENSFTDDWLASMILTQSANDTVTELPGVHVWGYRPPSSGNGTGGGDGGSDGIDTDYHNWPDYSPLAPPVPGSNLPDQCVTQIGMDEYVQNFMADWEHWIKTKLAGAVSNMSDMMRAIPQSLEIRLPSSAYNPGFPGDSSLVVISGAELRDLWSKADIWIMAQPTDDNQYGAAQRNNGNPELGLWYAGLPSYLQTDESSAWLLLHELIHTTSFGDAAKDQAYRNWQANKDTPDFRNSIYHAQNEIMVNGLARDIGALFGLDLTKYPAGFGYSQHSANITGVSGPLTPIEGDGPGGPCSSAGSNQAG